MGLEITWKIGKNVEKNWKIEKSRYSILDQFLLTGVKDASRSSITKESSIPGILGIQYPIRTWTIHYHSAGRSIQNPAGCSEVGKHLEMWQVFLLQI